MIMFFIYLLILDTAFGQLIESNFTGTFTISQSGTLPLCWTPDCRTLSEFTVISQGQPKSWTLPNFLSESFVIFSGELFLDMSYCSDTPSLLPSQSLNLSINDYHTVLEFPIDGHNCSSFNGSIIIPNESRFWTFFNYQNDNSPDPTNTFSFSVDSNIYIMIQTMSIHTQAASIDPEVTETVPLTIVNPYTEPTEISTGVTYFDTTLTYYCLLRCSRVPAYNAIGIIQSYSYMEDNFWLLTCAFESQPPPLVTLTYGQMYIGMVYVVPILFNFSVTLTSYKTYLCETPRITAIYPNSASPGDKVEIFGFGFRPGTSTAMVQPFLGPDKIDNWEATTTNDTYMELIVPTWNIPSSQLCLKITINLQDTTDCSNPASTFYYFNGPVPVPSPQVPAPVPVPSPSNYILNWLNHNWWAYVVGGALIFLLLSSLVVYIGYRFKRRSSYTRVEGDSKESLDDREGIETRALINMDDLQIHEMIGSGSFAAVHRGYWRKTEVAVKMLQSKVKNEKSSFLKETTLMLNLRHPNIVSLMGVVWSPRLCIITEFCTRGDVAQVMLDPAYIVEPEHIRRICLDTCRGMTYLHGENVIHRDLKARNLLIDKDWNVKVADFGLARSFNEQPGTMTACGTPTHAAPEVIKHLHYTTQADVYSFGICIWEMCVRQEPYESIPGFQVIVAVATKRMRPKIPPTIDSTWASLIRRCWAEDPDSRPQFQELVEFFVEMAKKLPIPSKKMPYKLDPKKTSSNPNSPAPSSVHRSEARDYSPVTIKSHTTLSNSINDESE